MSHDSISAAKNVSKENKNTDPAFDQVIDEMSKHTSRLWNSVELQNASTVLHLAGDSEDDTQDLLIGKLAKSIRDEVHQIDHDKSRVTCSYDEILRFKKSAALAATKDIKLSGINHGGLGLIQAVADNFDADISSQNGNMSTHSLAMLITQPSNASDDDLSTRESIQRVKKSEMSEDIDFEIPVLCSAILSERRAKVLDIAFLRDVTNTEACLEYNGYNTRLTRQQGVSMQPKTTAVYLTLIHMTSSDPDTIMTAVHEAKRLSKKRGQKNTIFTSDQQLYRVVSAMGISK
ncbi:Hypothetical predicted protein [Paramuricea clavata]|uniref:Uncharacterized protein n=1 Tax=Paramuricea clavata TaxID=317549 RepID=A0A6S7I9V8_PARCT|nr:Hypothetical predicted protein [Paramuricea clavata]